MRSLRIIAASDVSPTRGADSISCWIHCIVQWILSFAERKRVGGCERDIGHVSPDIVAAATKSICRR